MKKGTTREVAECTTLFPRNTLQHHYISSVADVALTTTQGTASLDKETSHP